MEKATRIISLKDKKNDLAYWLSKTPQERIDAVEILRDDYIRYLKNVPERLPRVYSIVNKKDGSIRVLV